MSAVSAFVGTPVRPPRDVSQPPPRQVPRRAPTRKAVVVVRAGAPAAAASLLGSAHFLLANPVVLSSLSGMAATAAWALTERPTPRAPAPRRGAPPPKPSIDFSRVALACIAAAVPLTALLAVHVGLRHLQLDPAKVGADAIRHTLCAGLAGVHAILALGAAAVNGQLLATERAPGLMAAAAALAAPVACVAHAFAMQQGVRWAGVAPAAVMWACYGAALGHHMGSGLADRLRAARAPVWCEERVLQSATCLGAASGRRSCGGFVAGVIH